MVGLIIRGVLVRFPDPLTLYRIDILGEIYLSLIVLLILIPIPSAILVLLKRKKSLHIIIVVIITLIGYLIGALFLIRGFFAMGEVYMNRFGTKTSVIKDKIEIRTECTISCSRRIYVHTYLRTSTDGKEYDLPHWIYLHSLKEHLDIKYFGEIETRPRQLPGVYCLKTLEYSPVLLDIERCDN